MDCLGRSTLMAEALSWQWCNITCHHNVTMDTTSPSVLGDLQMIWLSTTTASYSHKQSSLNSHKPGCDCTLFFQWVNFSPVVSSTDYCKLSLLATHCNHLSWWVIIMEGVVSLYHMWKLLGSNNIMCNQNCHHTYAIGLGVVWGILDGSKSGADLPAVGIVMGGGTFVILCHVCCS